MEIQRKEKSDIDIKGGWHVLYSNLLERLLNYFHLAPSVVVYLQYNALSRHAPPDASFDCYHLFGNITQVNGINKTNSLNRLGLENM
jgi:hypothetical protein